MLSLSSLARALSRLWSVFVLAQPSAAPPDWVLCELLLRAYRMGPMLLGGKRRRFVVLSHDRMLFYESASDAQSMVSPDAGGLGMGIGLLKKRLTLLRNSAVTQK